MSKIWYVLRFQHDFLIIEFTFIGWMVYQSTKINEIVDKAWTFKLPLHGFTPDMLYWGAQTLENNHHEALSVMLL